MCERKRGNGYVQGLVRGEWGETETGQRRRDRDRKKWWSGGRRRGRERGKTRAGEWVREIAIERPQDHQHTD